MLCLAARECQTPSIESLPGQVGVSGGRAAAGRGHGEGGGRGEAARVASADVGWAQEAQAQARGRQHSQAGQGAAPAQAGAVAEASRTRDLAGVAARVEPEVPPLLRAHRAVLRARARPVRLPARSLLGAGKPHPPGGRGARREGARARHAGAGRAHREGAEPAHAAEGDGFRGPLPRSHPALAHAGRERARVRLAELPPSLPSGAGALRGRSARPVQLGVARAGERSTRRAGTDVVAPPWDGASGPARCSFRSQPPADRQTEPGQPVRANPYPAATGVA